MRICFVRHGQTDWNLQKRMQGREDVPLNATGLRQAEQLGRVIVAHKWAAIVTSPLSRAYDTAVVLGKHCGLADISKDEGLIERDFGNVAGTTCDEKYRGTFNFDMPGIEPYKLLEERAYSTLIRISKRFRGSDVIVVSHGDTISALIYKLSDGRINADMVCLKNACMNLVSGDDRGFKIVFFNKTCDDANEIFPLY